MAETQTFRHKREADDEIRFSYNRDEAQGLTDMLGAVAGKTIERVIVGGTVGDDYEDGVYAICFTDGTGFMVDYVGGSPGYSEWTPASPGYVTYYTLTLRHPAPASQESSET